jgi:hypothetical protein
MVAKQEKEERCENCTMEGTKVVCDWCITKRGEIETKKYFTEVDRCRD